MKSTILRSLSFAVLTAFIYWLLWNPFHKSYHRPMRIDDFLICVAIQTCVPLLAWIALAALHSSRGTQVVVTLFWTWTATAALILCADRFHNSAVYQQPRPWDYLFSEGGIIAYLGLLVPILGLVAAGLTFLPRRNQS